jgi:hypothetical protein
MGKKQNVMTFCFHINPISTIFCLRLRLPSLPTKDGLFRAQVKAKIVV